MLTSASVMPGRSALRTKCSPASTRSIAGIQRRAPPLPFPPRLVGVSKKVENRRFISPCSESISRTGSQRTTGISLPPAVLLGRGQNDKPECSHVKFIVASARRSGASRRADRWFGSLGDARRSVRARATASLGKVVRLPLVFDAPADARPCAWREAVRSEQHPAIAGASTTERGANPLPARDFPPCRPAR